MYSSQNDKIDADSSSGRRVRFKHEVPNSSTSELSGMKIIDPSSSIAAAVE